MRNFNFFDKLIASFRERHVRQLISRDAVLCDIGCGDDASLLTRLAPKIKKGIGFNPVIAVDSASLPANLELKELSLPARIPLPDESADVVTMLAVLEHLTEVDKVLPEVRRILKTGGKFFLTTPAPAAKPILEFLAFKIGLISADEIRDHKHYFTKNELLGLLAEAGFPNNKISHRFFEFGLNQRITAVK